MRITYIPLHKFQERNKRLQQLASTLRPEDWEEMSRQFKVTKGYLRSIVRGDLANTDPAFQRLARMIKWINDLDIEKANQKAEILKKHNL